jgi:hypothetical protein
VAQETLDLSIAFSVSQERICANLRKSFVHLLEILDTPDDDPINDEPDPFDYKGVYQG